MQEKNWGGGVGYVSNRTLSPARSMLRNRTVGGVECRVPE